MAKYMFIVAHPDDEVLGAGAFIYDSIMRGHEVCVLIMNGTNIETRPNMENDIKRSHYILGVSKSIILNFPNLRIRQLSSADVVPVLEQHISAFKPDYIFTHWKADINPDHKAVFEFSEQASRLTQRTDNSEWSIKGLLSMEVLSSTDWGGIFDPDVFVPVSEEGISRKIDALKVYENVMRGDCHPRSERGVKALACLRGISVGVLNAESFRTIWTIGDFGCLK